MPTEAIYRLSVDQYHDMINSGILTEEDGVELLDGWLVPKMSISPAHRYSTEQTRDGVAGTLPPGWHVYGQQPITAETSEPEPDVQVARGQRRDYQIRHPRPNELGMVAEVADTTLQKDRGSKKRIYARENIPVYWIVNLVDNQIEVYTDPTGPMDQPDYRQRRDYKPGEEVPVVIEGKELGRLAVADLLPETPRGN